MKITEAELRDIILEELKTVANSKHPSDVEMVEDDTGGGALSDDYEHVPEDVPADSEKAAARIQRKEPLVREKKYSLKSVLEEMKYMGGLGFTNGSIAEGHCGCGDPDMAMHHVPSDHVVQALADEEGRDLDHSDHEGSMALSQLRRAAKYSQQLGHMIRESDDLPEWVESKITKASDYLGSVYHYLDYEINGKKQ